MLEEQERILQRVTATQISAFYAWVHQDESIKLLTNTAIESVTGSQHAKVVVYAGGTVLPADLE